MGLNDLIVRTKQIMEEEGVYETEALFLRLKGLAYDDKLRRAIHIAKASIFK